TSHEGSKEAKIGGDASEAIPNGEIVKRPLPPCKWRSLEWQDRAPLIGEGMPSGCEKLLAQTGFTLEGRDAKRIYKETKTGRPRGAREELHNAGRVAATER
ncbi:MAG: hypothetical protein ABIO24_13455, partial [Saprospiraceae bacterium]